ncbi:MAG: 3D-(3,5/4)-trihydroxycyclohexane-1,2-dione acylhydrolase (decyclizing) [Candidatus Thioglobus sp.]|jgi:3D-(3,5/4)-trihydroxycyclohexane-1,2-dione acylhydrolase (decyclizing)|nr:3D-(3,5/4)-trihydroxycyclohexane-1,2-dione acylhydrolase (decyclizing) [Candidatus Thioglobus sp.]|tara:strand:- start:486 stop:2342 length:1857 start_codon:yes stop_codon:yes gene_type:complete
MKTIRLTMAQAVVKYLSAQHIKIDDEVQPIFAGVFAIFGHGNVAGMGQALEEQQKHLPTLRAHSEQGMVHAAIAYAKANKRQRMMACTSSIGPGATNMITAAALAHVNRLPVLLLPGDFFASRTPDPVLQQLEDFSNPTISVNDCFKTVSRYFDRIMRPEQIINSLPVAMQTLLDPENCGPVTLSLPQDVQAEAFDYPEEFFIKRTHSIRQIALDNAELTRAVEALLQSKKPLIVAGGGVHYAKACEALQKFAGKYQIPVAETQAGKGSLAWDHPCYVGAIGVTGSNAANNLAQQADVVLAIGTRLQDFTTGSRTLFANTTLLQLNVSRFDAIKHSALSLLGDAKLGIMQLDKHLSTWKAPRSWFDLGQKEIAKWNSYYDQITSISDLSNTENILPTDAQVLGEVKRHGTVSDIVLCAAGSLPGELHKLWRTEQVGGYHAEYGFSCMGYEIAGGLGVKMAEPEREVIVLVGDGSYLMLNSELATSVMLGHKIIVIVLDNRGFSCINRLQNATGNRSFNNLLKDCQSVDDGHPEINFAMHAKALGANSEQVNSIQELESALVRAQSSSKSYVISLVTDSHKISPEGGCWWEVAVPEVSSNIKGKEVLKSYKESKTKQPY